MASPTTRSDQELRDGAAAAGPLDPVIISVAASSDRSEASENGIAPPVACSVFKEVLEDPTSPIPTLDELETFGLFDLSESERLLAEYRLVHPHPLRLPDTLAAAQARPREAPLRQSNDPQNRYSLASLQLPPYWPTSSALSSPSDASRLNPFAFVRKPSARPRLSERTKSGTDVPTSSPATRPVSAYDMVNGGVLYPYPGEKGLERDATLKADKRPPARKLRKAPPPRITVRTDETALLRPVSSKDTGSTLSVDSASRDSNSRSRRTSWTSNASSSYPHSPVTYETDEMHPSPMSDAQVTSRQALGRNSASVAEHEFVVKRREATSSSAESLHYQADNERNRSSPRVARSTRASFGFASSPTSSIPSPSRWVKPWGFDRMRRGGNSTPSSPTVGNSPASGPTKPDSQTFEVLSRPSRRPSLDRSSSTGIVPADSCPPAPPSNPQLGAAATSDRHAEAGDAGDGQPGPLPDELDSMRRLAERPSRKSLARGISFDSVRTPSGSTTPAMISTASSGTIRQLDAGAVVGEHPVRSAKLSELLRASVNVQDPFGDEERRRVEPGATSPIEDDVLDSSRANSTTDSWASSSSSRSRSRDSLSYCSGDETPASSAVENDDEPVRESNDDDAFDVGKAPIPLGATGVTLVATPTVFRLA
ncbi:hypothetical protein JCM8115_001742 [Rhodotorula mucilaginosa]